MNAKDAAAVKKAVKAEKINVRGFLTTKFDYFDAHQERVLTVAEA